MHFVKILLVSAFLFATLGVIARLLFPEWFIPRYEIEFSGSSERPQENVSPYAVQNSVAPNALAQYLSEEFSLPQQAGGGYTYFDPITQASVTNTSDNSGAQFSDPTAAPTEGDTLIPQDTAEQAARQFLEGLGYPTELSVTAVSLHKSEGVHLEEASAADASVYKFTFVPSLNALSVTTPSGTSSEIDVFVSQKGVFKAFLPPLIFTATRLQEQSVLSVEAALNNLSLGQFSSPDVQEDSQKLGKFSLTSRELVYRFNADLQQIVPMYRFSGTYTNAANQTREVEVYVNAIE